MDDVGFELWLAAQRAMPSSARGRMNVTVDNDLAGGDGAWRVIWGSAGAIAGASYTLLGAAVLFFTSLLLAPRLSINFAGDTKKGVSGVVSFRIEPKEVTPIAPARELLKPNDRREIMTTSSKKMEPWRVR